MGKNLKFRESPSLQMSEAELFNTPDPVILPLAKFGRDPLLSRSEEQSAFHRLNYSKWMICRLGESELTPIISEEILRWHKRYTIYNEYIMRANIGLVISTVMKVQSPLLSHHDKVSEGNMALVRAIDAFNPDRGIKFSTYACNVIARALTTMKKRTQARIYKRIRTVEYTPECEYNNWIDQTRNEEEQEYINQLRTIINENLAELSNVEIGIIKKRFNWECKLSKPLTLDEVGEIIGLSKERVRQIQVHAIDKIRTMMQVAKRKHAKRYTSNHAVRTT